MKVLRPQQSEFVADRVDVSSHIAISGLSPDDFYSIKDDLTFINPEYLNVKKYSKWKNTRVPEYLTYYDISGDTVSVPRGYKFPMSKANKRINNTLRCKATYPEFCLQLRETQQEAAEAYIKNNQTLDLNGIIQLPTGKGKSILGTYLAYKLQQRTLIIVHKDDLITGWKEDIELCFKGKVKCGLIKAKKRDLGEQITLATIQTLSRLSSDELQSLVSKFGMIILDEMHHCPSSSYSVIQCFPARYLLGLTATPERADGLTHVMHLYFGGFAYRYKNSGKEEDILPVRVIKCESPVVCEPVCQKTTAKSGDIYSLKYFNAPKGKTLSDDEILLSEVPYNKRPKVSYQLLDDIVVSNEEYVNQVLSDICREFSLGRSCVVFFTQKKHIDLYFEKLVSLIGIDNVVKYYGDNKTNDLTKKVAEEKRQLVTLSTYKKGTEGTNVRQWEVEFLVSSINDEKNTEQVAGRIRRLKDNKINPVIIYDYSHPKVYSLRNHFETRKRRYKQLGFILPPEPSKKRALFGRGF